MSNATIDGSNPALLKTKGYINGDNETTHVFSILLNNTGLIGEGSLVKDAAYQIIPKQESFMINLTYINSTLFNRESCFNISLNNTIVTDGTRTITFFDPIIDEVPIHMTTPQPVKYNVTIPYNTTANRRGINWEAPQIYIYLTFNLDIKAPRPLICNNYQGSQFLNSTNTTPLDRSFDYNYDFHNVTQPQLRDAVVEVAVW
jgi:hypothetical protein